MSDRIVKYMEKSGGGRNIGLKVNGVSILIEGTGGNQEEADLLAILISELGPEELPKPSVTTDNAIESPAPRTPKKFCVGDAVQCTVRGKFYGWQTVVEKIGTDHNRGMMKVAGSRPWCPVHNFEHVTK